MAAMMSEAEEAAHQAMRLGQIPPPVAPVSRETLGPVKKLTVCPKCARKVDPRGFRGHVTYCKGGPKI